MPPIEIGPLRATGAIDSRLARKPDGGSAHSARADKSESALVRSRTLDPGAAPIDAERVEVIRAAIEKGSYPVIPARIADAMIAAGILLRSGK